VLQVVEHWSDGMSSPVVKEEYVVDPWAPEAIADDPVPGYYHVTQQIKFRANEAASIYYTTDGSTPTTSSQKFTESPRIFIDHDVTFKVLAVDLAGNASDVLTAEYHVNVGQTAVGPSDPATGFPSYYRDSKGLSLQLCIDNSGACLTTVADPTQPPSVPGNFIDEAFWWNATAEMPAGPANAQGLRGKARLVLATEAAFASGAVKAGQQIAFNRIRVRVDGLVPGETYAITHPYGKEILTADATGTINSTEDIGCLDAGGTCLATRVLDGRVGPWLRWDSGAPTGYVGDGATPHQVTGSPSGTNFFLIEGRDAGGAGVDRQETALFVVAGKLSTAP